MSTTIVWFRNDLRLLDNPALHHAVAESESVIPLYVHAPDEAGHWAPGGATKWWLHHSLEDFGERLEKAGSPLVIREGGTVEEILDVIKESGADAVYWNQAYEPFERAIEEKLIKKLDAENIAWAAYDGSVLLNPEKVRNGKDEPYKVFTPYWKAVAAQSIPEPLRAPKKITAPSKKVKTVALKKLALLPKIHWDAGIAEHWTPGEKKAHEVLKHFMEDSLTDYLGERNLPDRPVVSFLSPYLHFGEISPRTLWHELNKYAATTRGVSKDADGFLRQLVWREFAYYLMYYFPHTPEQPLRPEFEKFPWQNDKKMLKAWQKGQTGFPIVDAGMRQLWVTGWMHNRVRLITASFLVKDLMIGWQAGADWYWDTLVDADLGNNTLGWQWVAGCGADAAPYFRIFNPILQGEKFDPKGNYVRKWCPELAKLDNKWLHRPWEAPEEVLEAAGIELGRDYPEPLVNHHEARTAALAAYSHLKK